MATYDAGDCIRLTATWKNISNANVDPSAVVLKIQSPDGTSNEYTYAGGDVVKSATGVFYYDFVPSDSGKYVYRWTGTGSAIAAGQSTFFVEDGII